MKKLKAVLATVAAIACFLLLSTAAEARRLPWCGIYMNQYFGLSKRSLWVARNWAHEGTGASGPQVGAVVVWRHHVGVIAGPPDAAGRWLVHSGNDGNAVRTRYRSLAGAIAFRHVGGGASYASANQHFEVQQHAQAGGLQNLNTLAVERGGRTARLRQTRAVAEVAREPVAEFTHASTFAQPARLTRKARAQQIAAMRERPGVLLSFGGPMPNAVGSLQNELPALNHHRAPRIDRARAVSHPSSQAWPQSASHTPPGMQWPGSAERGLYVGGGGDWHGYPPRAAPRGYKLRYRRG